MNGSLLSLLALIVTLGVLISFHEFGHFWVARRLGVKVLRFSIGFGKPLWSRRGKTDDTEYVIAAIPLGGYVQMLDEREGNVPAQELSRAFNRKPVGSRIAIVAAGPAFNFIFAILINNSILWLLSQYYSASWKLASVSTLTSRQLSKSLCCRATASADNPNSSACLNSSAQS